jgi:hypothetical protein
MGQIKHYNNGKWTIYTSGEDLSGYTGTTDTYYIGVNNTDGDLSKVNPDGELINLEKPNVGFTGFTYEIGEYVASEGGVIYHRFLTDTTQNYLVVDTVNLGQYEWSNINNSTSGAISSWNGQYNTDVIMLQGAISGAAYECKQSFNGGKNDWYLPAIEELRKIWFNMLDVEKGLEQSYGQYLTVAETWTSTEGYPNYPLIQNEGTTAWFISQFPGDPTYGNVLKTNPLYVRAVRKFSI